MNGSEDAGTSGKTSEIRGHEQDVRPLEGRAFHLIGIGGAGMSVVAELLREQGADVTGSDRAESAVLRSLLPQGIGAYSPHRAQRVPEDAVIVVSSAIRESNEELKLARHRGQVVIHRSEALALAARGQQFIAVAGAHGKTTTSAMIAVGLLESGRDPSFAIGGPVLGTGSGARTGSGPFVAEADESDGSFLHYAPSVAVITNVEPDHLDHFGSRERFFGIFEQFVDRIVPGGTLICCAEDDGSARIAEYGKRAANVGTVWTYGREGAASAALGADPAIVITDMRLRADGSSATLRFEGDLYELSLRVTGEHNILNATAAWAACVSVGVAPASAALSLRQFRGAGRRFELRADIDGKRVYNDYAHHPTEVEAAVRQARIVAGPGRLIAVFQPHLYSRTRNFADQFAAALSLADEVVLTDIYAAREDPVPGVTTKLIADSPLMRKARFVPDMNEAAAAAAASARPGDVLLLIGAGDIFLQADTVADTWRRTADSAS